jgi:hypothetical protein
MVVSFANPDVKAPWPPRRFHNNARNFVSDTFRKNLTLESVRHRGEQRRRDAYSSRNGAKPTLAERVATVGKNYKWTGRWSGKRAARS